MNKHVLVIGGGVAGLEAAGRLSKEGVRVSLIESSGKTGGHVNDWFKLFPDRKNSSEVKSYLEKLVIKSGIEFINGSSAEKFIKDHDKFLTCTSEGKEIVSDAIIVATGFDLFKSSRKEEYGYGIYDNVITSADLEKMFSAGKISLVNGNTPEKIGFVHCVGSRDEKAGNLYCSKLCCVTAVKQAIEIRESIPGSKVFSFYMDMRMGGAHYEELYMEAQQEWGINFIRGKVSEVSESHGNKLVIKVEDTLAGRPLKIELDMLVLMPGMEMSENGKRFALNSGLRTGGNRFFAATDHHYGSNRSDIDGVFYAGTCTAPMNITETISHSRSAALEVIDYLKHGSK